MCSSKRHIMVRIMMMHRQCLSILGHHIHFSSFINIHPSIQIILQYENLLMAKEINFEKILKDLSLKKQIVFVLMPHNGFTKALERKSCKLGIRALIMERGNILSSEIEMGEMILKFQCLILSKSVYSFSHTHKTLSPNPKYLIPHTLIHRQYNYTTTQLHH